MRSLQQRVETLQTSTGSATRQERLLDIFQGKLSDVFTGKTPDHFSIFLKSIRGEQVRSLQQRVETLQTSSDSATRDGEKTFASLSVCKAELIETHEKVFPLSPFLCISLCARY